MSWLLEVEEDYESAFTFLKETHTHVFFHPNKGAEELNNELITKTLDVPTLYD